MRESSKMGKGPAVLYIAIVCAVLGITGCTTEEDTTPPPALAWKNSQTALRLEPGTANIGDMVYTAAHTSPKADSYTLYYVEGKELNAAKVRNGTKEEVDGKTDTMTGTIQFTNYKDGTVYSAVLVAQKTGYPDSVTPVVTGEAKASAYLSTIKFTNIPVGEIGDDKDEDTEVAFIWVTVGSSNAMGVGVYGGKLNPNSQHTYNEITTSGEMETPLYDGANFYNFLLAAGTSLDKVDTPPERQASGSGEITVQYRVNKDGTAVSMDGMKKKRWVNQTYKGDPLELDWTKGEDY